MSSTEAAPGRIVPAHLDFLAIYNPSLGLSEETEKDQIVFYWSKIANDATGQACKDDDAVRVARDTANEQLRQIGLAQGIVHFARGFAKGEAVDSIDTEKHRIVLQQLEPGWWILASINLTILPTSRRNPSTEVTEGPHVDYSAREVSPPSLLLAQLTTARRIFELHHGPSLSDLYGRVKRTKFCKLLDIYWTAFARDWDVLLHGNPAVDIYNGIKLAAGGELGMGVGEEEWGSGERDALEGIVSNTEGLVDLVVSRFGHATTPEHSGQTSETERHASNADVPWLGSLSQPEAVDGIIFTGVGALSRTSLRLISSWMATIYTYGEDAYGILDNPSSGRRSRRPHALHRSSTQTNPTHDTQNAGQIAVQRENTDDTITERSYAAALKAETEASSEHISEQIMKDTTAEVAISEETQPQKRQAENAARADPAEVAADLPKPKLEDPVSSGWAPSHITSIPPPIVSAAEDALKHATEQAEETAKKRDEAEKLNGNSGVGMASLSADKWSKYLTLGYGSSWHIPGLPKNDMIGKTSHAGSKKVAAIAATGDERGKSSTETRRVEQSLHFAAPSLRVSDSVGDEPNPTAGRYLIGFKGDLNGRDSGPESEGSESQDDGGDRIVIRTIHAGVNVPDKPESMKSSGTSSRSRVFYDENGSMVSTIEMKRLRVVIYVNQPFIFTFLFDLSSEFDGLSTPSFFRRLHANLAPLHKPLLASTSPSNVASRLSGFLTVPLPYKDGVPGSSPIYDLVHDPYNMTVHTSIPNIPLPGTLAAEGLLPYGPHSVAGSGGKTTVAPWTRLEALNVHSQILSAFSETRRQDGDREHQAKTSRGWWVVWMRLTATATYDSASEGHGGSVDGEGFREAVLVRRASDHALALRADGSPRKASGYGLGRLIGRDDHGTALSEGGNGSESENGAGLSWGPGRVTEGIGVDVRKYVESLLSLSR